MWKFIFAIPLLFHGLAHVSGFLASWTSINAGYAERTWIFSQTVHLQHGIGRIFGLLWLVASAGLVGSALGIVLHRDWWPALAIASAAVSIVVIAPWWGTVPPGAKVGATFDLLVLVLLLSPLQGKLLEFIR
jgi:hypothetical protein